MLSYLNFFIAVFRHFLWPYYSVMQHLLFRWGEVFSKVHGSLRGFQSRQIAKALLVATRLHKPCSNIHYWSNINILDFLHFSMKLIVLDKVIHRNLFSASWYSSNSGTSSSSKRSNCSNRVSSSYVSSSFSTSTSDWLHLVLFLF